MAAQRIYKTADGRYVAEGDPDAAFLAFTQFDEVPDDVLAKMKGGPAQDKQRKRAPRKKAAESESEPAEADDKE